MVHHPFCEYSVHKYVAHVPHLQQDTVQVTGLMMDRRQASLYSTNNTTHPFSTDARISIQMIQQRIIEYSAVKYSMV